MIQFREKTYSSREYDAMRTLYVNLCRRFDRNRIKTIESNQLAAALKGNNVIIERFVINKPPFGVDTYRIYLKIGARAKMPDQVRLPSHKFKNRFGDIKTRFRAGWGDRTLQFDQNYERFDPKTDTRFSNTNEPRQKLFKDNKKNNNNGGGENMSFEFTPFIPNEYESQELMADVLLFNKKSRTLVLEAKTVDSIIDSLNVLPFGLNYNILLLDA